MRAYIGFIAAVLLLAACADAIKVGVIVQYPEGETYAKCITANEGENGYDILQKTDLSISWSTNPAWGHGMCGVDGVGCPADNCWCTDKYWGFYVMHEGEHAWTYSPVGFDGGTGCGEHYCAKEGDVVGFAYGTYGTKPAQIAYSEVCSGKLPRKKYARGFAVTVEPQNIYAGDDIKLTVLDGYGSPVTEADVEAYTGTPGTSAVIFAGEIRNGTINFTLHEEGSYTLRVTAKEYHPSQEYVGLPVHPRQTTTSTTTTTTTTETTTTTAGTTTTSSLTASSSSISTTSTTTTTAPESSATPAATGMAVSTSGLLAGLLLSIVAAAYYLWKKG